MNKQYEYEQNLRGSPDNFFEKWLFWHGMTLLQLRPKDTPNKNLACFVIYLKITNTFFDIFKHHLEANVAETQKWQ